MVSFDYYLLGKKVKDARKSLLIQPSEAADKLKINVETYLNLESGNQKFTGDQVLILADFYRRDFRYFVTGDYPSAESQIQELFRLNASLSKKDRLAIQEFVRLCEYENFLEKEVFKKEESLLPKYEENLAQYYYKEQALEAASQERLRINLGVLPIIDIFEILREQGIHVFKRKLEDRNISGLYLNHPLAGHCILINYLDDLYRQNFSAAHEYCHALFDSSRGQEITYFHKSSEKIEKRANYFARNFLLPKKGITKKYQPVQDYEKWVELIRNICHDFKVSSKPVIFQLEELEWIDIPLKETLLKERRLIIRKDEKIDPEIPDSLSDGQKERLSKIIHQGLSWYFIELSTKAYRQGEITYQKLLEMLDLPLQNGRNLLNELRTFMEAS